MGSFTIIDIFSHPVIPADIRLDGCQRDLESMPYLTLGAYTHEREIISCIRRRQHESLARQFAARNRRAEHDAVRLVAEQHILETESAPTTANIYIDNADLSLCPNALDHTIGIIMSLMILSCTILLHEVFVAVICLTLEIEAPVLVDLEFSL